MTRCALECFGTSWRRRWRTSTWALIIRDRKGSDISHDRDGETKAFSQKCMSALLGEEWGCGLAGEVLGLGCPRDAFGGVFLKYLAIE